MLFAQRVALLEAQLRRVPSLLVALSGGAVLRWVEDNPDDVAATLALAGTYSEQDRVEPAIAQYQQVLEKDDQNVGVLNNLAWHLRDKQPAKALEYAERAAVDPRPSLHQYVRRPGAGTTIVGDQPT